MTVELLLDDGWFAVCDRALLAPGRARLAARTVLRQARGEEIDPPRVELATELVLRASTAAHA